MSTVSSPAVSAKAKTRRPFASGLSRQVAALDRPSAADRAWAAANLNAAARDYMVVSRPETAEEMADLERRAEDFANAFLTQPCW